MSLSEQELLFHPTSRFFKAAHQSFHDLGLDTKKGANLLLQNNLTFRY